MPQSRREQIVREVMARCQAAIAPVIVLRQPVTAIPREQAPALVVSIASDATVKRSTDRMERELVLRIIGHARDPTDGYAVADDLLCRAHSALLLDATLGGLALNVAEMDADYQAEDADVEAIAIPAYYRITYRSLGGTSQIRLASATPFVSALLAPRGLSVLRFSLVVSRACARSLPVLARVWGGRVVLGKWLPQTTEA